MPVIFNQRNCQEGGGANYGLSMNNSKSNVAAQFNIKVFVNNKKIAESTYVIPAGSSRSITTISGVPEGARYKARIITRDVLGSNKSVGKFKKKTNCIKDEITTTTTPGFISPLSTLSLRGPLVTDESSVSTTTTIALPEELSLTDNALDDNSSLVVGGQNSSPPTTLGPIEQALTKTSSVIVNNKVDQETKINVEDVSEVKISNKDVSLSISLTCTIGCDQEEIESNKFVKLTNSSFLPEQVIQNISNEADAVIKGEIDGQINIEASGFEPNSYVEVYMFSEPTFVGILQTDSNGEIVGNLPTPDLDPGIHTLQALGTSQTGDSVVSNVKVELVDTDQVAFTNIEGNDYVAWDFNVDDNYEKDEDYLVQYYYIENQIGSSSQTVLANTGFNLNYFGIAGISAFFGGLFLFTKNRKKRLIATEPSKAPLDKIYKNIFILKSIIESLIDEKVEILINFNKLNPYENKGLYTQSQNEIIDNLNQELLNLISSARNIENKSTIDKKITTNEISKILDLISSNKIEFKFSGEMIDNQSRTKKTFSFDFPSETTINKKNSKFSLNALALFSVLTLFTGMLTIGYVINEMYLSNSKQESAQVKLAAMYLDESNKEVSDIKFEDEANLINLENVFNDIPVFENVKDVLSSLDSETTNEFQPEVFGYLEIDSINLRQYVVSGTSEDLLELGPGHYINTAIPGTGGNVGIAGHRTTYGAPFNELDLIELGDEIQLTVDSNIYHYKVDSIDIVDAVGGEYVLFNRGDDRLTLTTCHPKYSAKERLIVSGILTKIETVS